MEIDKNFCSSYFKFTKRNFTWMNVEWNIWKKHLRWNARTAAWNQSKRELKVNLISILCITNLTSTLLMLVRLCSKLSSLEIQFLYGSLIVVSQLNVSGNKIHSSYIFQISNLSPFISGRNIFSFYFLGLHHSKK